MRPPSFWNFFGSRRNSTISGDFLLGFLDAGHVLEGDLVLVPREHAGLGFAEIQRAFAGHADLLAEEEIEDEQEKAGSAPCRDQGGGEQVVVRLGVDRDLVFVLQHPLQVLVVLQIDLGLEFLGLAARLLDVFR